MRTRLIGAVSAGLLTLWLLAQASAQTTHWVVRHNGSGNSLDEAADIAVDDAGNVYVTGVSNNTDTGSDYVTIKYNTLGVREWLATYNTPGTPPGTPPGDDEARAIAVDEAGNVYVTGFGGSNGGDIATVRYNTDGIEQWVDRFDGGGGNTYDEGLAITVDSAGNVYVTGNTGGASPAISFATIKYNALGVRQWVRIYNGASNLADIPSAIAVDGLGNVYVTGRSDGSATGPDYATVKYNAAGVEQWVKTYNNTNSTDVAEDLALDSSGNIYVTGLSGGILSDYATIKYNPAGQQQWVTRYDGGGIQDRAHAIAVNSNAVYVTGEDSANRYTTLKLNLTSGVKITETHKIWTGSLLAEVRDIALDDAGNVYITGNNGANAEVDYATVMYNSDLEEQWTARYDGPGNNYDSAQAIAVDHERNVYVTGISLGVGTGNDYATVKYGPGDGGGEPPDPTCQDSFDDLALGSLDGQNGWHTVPGRTSASVIQNPFGAGRVLLMDAGPNQTVIMGKDVNDQAHGIHTVELAVLVDKPSDPLLKSLAKIEVRTTGNPNWDKKFQLYFGTHMRLNYGPGLGQAVEFLSSDDLVSKHWYKVKAVVDLDTNQVDVYLDDVLKLQDISVGPGPITDIGLSAWERPGFVLFDDLHSCQIGPGVCAATSTFSAGNEGWTVVGDAQSGSMTPDFHATGGMPGGYIAATDNDTGGTWYWQAPAKFLGNALCTYGQALNFDLRQSAADNQFDGEDVILEGGGLKLVYDAAYNPATDWTGYSIPLVENAGWKKTTLAGAAPTQAEMQAVLSSLTQLRIRGEYRNGVDTGDLDNVLFSHTPRGAGPALFTAFHIDDDMQGNSQGDGDGRIEPGEQVELAIDLTNYGIQAATGITATLVSSDPDVAIVKSDNSWADIPAGASQVSSDSFGLEVAPGPLEEKLVTFTLTIRANNGGPWISTFDMLIAPKSVYAFLPLISR